MLLSTTDSEVLTATERFANALAETKAESDRDEFASILIECNEELKQELGVDYGAVCSDNDCC